MENYWACPKVFYDPMAVLQDHMGCSRASKCPATSNGSLKADRYSGGTAGEEPEDVDTGNPDIWIPAVQNAERPRQPNGEDGEKAEAGQGRGERERKET
ncbi:hypothetical protein NDU88_002792 [Pleurodeles waltl]|uniref:CHHC U11-48K-type domain-containing protein n=1 Tax=Pleurodeles waltl TaxID=8319 RepID=A0AAV7UWL7_PLEWA|nr:hypothetical protein NDU88_002792 [Pleurodeles waltl]